MLRGIEQSFKEKQFSTMCRLCIENFDPYDMLEIFDSAYNPIEMKITCIIQIKICCGDGLPSTICKSCVGKLQVTSQFIADSISTDDFLRKVVTFISEVRSDMEVQNVTEHTLEIFELISGNNKLSLCRLCKTKHNSSDMSKIFGSDNSYCEQIKRIIHLQPSKGDKLPDSICNACIAKLNEAQNFISKSTSNDYLLQNTLFKATEFDTPITCESNLEPKDSTQESTPEFAFVDVENVSTDISLEFDPLAILKDEKDRDLQTSLLPNEETPGVEPKDENDPEQQTLLVSDTDTTGFKTLPVQNVEPTEKQQQQISNTKKSPIFNKVSQENDTPGRRLRSHTRKMKFVGHSNLFYWECTYLCQVCSKAFTTLRGCGLHEMTHSKGAANDRDFCKTKLSSKKTRQINPRLQTGVRLFSLECLYGNDKQSSRSK